MTLRQPQSPAAGKHARPLGSLAKIAVQGAAYSLVQNVGIRVIAFLAQMVLARLLMPADFGQIGLALTINALVQPMVDFGIEDVLVSRRKSMSLWIRPAYGLSISLSLLAGALIALTAPFAAAIYNSPNLTGLLLFMAPSCAIWGFSIIPSAKVRADLRFGVTSGWGLLEIVLSQGCTMILAALGFGAYSFVIPAPFLSLLKSVVFYRLAPIGFRGAFRVKHWRPLLSRASLVFGQRLLAIVREQGDYLLVGLVATQSVMGAYYFGFRLAAQPVYMLVRSLSVVLFPTLASLTHDRDRQTNAAIRAARILNFLVIPFSFCQAAAAQPLILLLFGPTWQPAVPYVQILSIGLAFDALPNVAGALATARGQFKFQLHAALLTSVLFVLCIGIGAAIDSAIGVACGVAVTIAVTSVVYPLMAFGPIDDRASVIARLWGEPVAMAGVGFGLAWVFANRLPADQPELSLAAIVLVGTSIYAVLFRIFQPQLTDVFLSRLVGAARGALRRAAA